MNGEHYQGGQFLPSTELPKIEKRTRKAATRKQEIAPYVWEVAPEGKRSIWRRWTAVWAWNKDRTGMEVYSGLNHAHFGEKFLAEAAEAAQKWNSGERWEDE